VHAATFDQMRRRAGELAPEAGRILKEPARFFRRGASGAAAELLTADELDHYRKRAAELVQPDVFVWLHRS
jgi:aryl sulfotransferase